MPPPRLSVCMIVKNGADVLPHVLRNVEDIADEIVVVDDHSTDGTVRLLERHPKVCLFQRPFRNFGDQKNFAFEQARGDWVLSLDQDELLGDRLRAAIPRAIRTRRYTHFKLPRYWLLSGPPWRYVHSDKHYPNWTPRLFRNVPFFRYGPDQLVHHHFPRCGRGPYRRLRGRHLFHFHFMVNSRDERERRVRAYSRLDPRTSTTHRTLLYELYDFRCRPCAEPLTVPGQQVTQARSRPFDVPVTVQLESPALSWSCP